MLTSTSKLSIRVPGRARWKIQALWPRWVPLSTIRAGLSARASTNSQSESFTPLPPGFSPAGLSAWMRKNSPIQAPSSREPPAGINCRRVSAAAIVSASWRSRRACSFSDSSRRTCRLSACGVTR
ncbi:MAG: hypothetical protein U5L06_05610 [Rhodovibrio sp.]|nr:hypothetical protein [Rhodovibrio sp.]